MVVVWLMLLQRWGSHAELRCRCLLPAWWWWLMLGGERWWLVE